MDALYKQFIQEKRYIENVSTATLDGYKWAWKAFEPALTGKRQITKADITQHIARLRQRGLSPVSVNTYVRSLNAFLAWAQREGHGVGLSKIGKLKEPRKILATFTDSHVSRLVGFKSRTAAERRIHTLACLLLDTGQRIDEALSLRREDVDLDGLVLRIRSGKGSKGRVVPFSLPARKLLFRFMTEQKPQHDSLVFFAAEGGRINQRNALRSFKRLCAALDIHGVRCSFHTLRHTFATHYFRAGGGEFRLQRILGHTTLEMTRRYVQLEIGDLTRAHHELSPLTQKSRS